VAFSSDDSTFENIVIRYLFKICNKEEFIRTAKKINPKVAKAGGLQSHGVKVDAVVGYRESLITQDLESSDFPAG
jgi:hypothetical protein